MLDFRCLLDIQTRQVFLIFRYFPNHHTLFLVLALLIQILHDQESSPTSNNEANIYRVPFGPLWALDNGEYCDRVEREDSPASCQHSTDSDSTRLSIVAQRHVDERHENGRNGGGDSEQVVAGKMVAFGYVPDEERNVGDDVDCLDDREDGPERVDHAQGCGEKRGEDRDTLSASGDSVDLWNGVCTWVLGSKIFKPNSHLTVRVRRRKEAIGMLVYRNR